MQTDFFFFLVFHFEGSNFVYEAINKNMKRESCWCLQHFSKSVGRFTFEINEWDNLSRFYYKVHFKLVLLFLYKLSTRNIFGLVGNLLWCSRVCCSFIFSVGSDYFSIPFTLWVFILEVQHWCSPTVLFDWSSAENVKFH